MSLNAHAPECSRGRARRTTGGRPSSTDSELWGYFIEWPEGLEVAEVIRPRQLPESHPGSGPSTNAPASLA